MTDLSGLGRWQKPSNGTRWNAQCKATGNWVFYTPYGAKGVCTTQLRRHVRMHLQWLPERMPRKQAEALAKTLAAEQFDIIQIT